MRHRHLDMAGKVRLMSLNHPYFAVVTLKLFFLERLFLGSLGSKAWLEGCGIATGMIMQKSQALVANVLQSACCALLGRICLGLSVVRL